MRARVASPGSDVRPAPPPPPKERDHPRDPFTSARWKRRGAQRDDSCNARHPSGAAVSSAIRTKPPRPRTGVRATLPWLGRFYASGRGRRFLPKNAITPATARNTIASLRLPRRCRKSTCPTMRGGRVARRSRRSGASRSMGGSGRTLRGRRRLRFLRRTDAGELPEPSHERGHVREAVPATGRAAA